MTSSIFLETKYLIDTTPAATLRDNWMLTDFFKKHCFFPEEIIYELGGNLSLNHSLLDSQKIKLSIETLYQLQNVMRSVESIVGSKTKRIVGLYHNEGNGDALLIATVLSEQNKELGKMFLTQWIIVTEDAGVARLAETFNIETMSKRQFYEILEGHSELGYGS